MLKKPEFGDAFFKGGGNPKGVRGATGKPPEKPLGALNIILALHSEWLYLTPQPPSL